MAENTGEIEKILYQQTALALHDNSVGDFQALKKIADNYLQLLDNLQSFYENTIKANSLKTKISEMYNKMKENEEYTRLMLQYQHDFEIGLNNFLGRTIFLTYVSEDGSIKYYNDTHVGKIYQQATAQRGRGNISKEKMFDANDLQEDIKKLLLESQNSKNFVYATAINRYTRNNNEYHMKQNPSKNTYWWVSLDGYHKTFTDPIHNKGAIAEGYINAVVNQDNEINNNNLQFSLMTLYYNYIKGKKDSIAAAVKGDVVFNQDGSIQFAVKSGNFSTSMIGQYINLAINIHHIQEISLEDFKKGLPKLIKLSKVADQIIKAANKKAIQKTKQEIINKVAVGIT